MGAASAVSSNPRFAITPEQSRLINAKLILLLANHVGDPTVLRQAMAKAREGVTPAGQDGVLQVVA